MKPRDAKAPLIAYSTNVHRCETLAHMYKFLRRFTLPIRDRVFPKQAGGLELRIGIETARALTPVSARREFAAFLATNNLFVFSINAFPLLDFHANRVKEQVYRPSWAEADRHRWTNKIATIFADLLPDGMTGSLSTSGGAYRRLGHDPRTFERLAHGYLKTLEKLVEIERNTGKTIILAAEPEPETTFETSRDVIEFFEGYLWPAARSSWKGRPQAIEERLRKFFTVNVDTCHFSVLFEDLIDSLAQLRRAGIRVGKLHVTNAIRLRNPFERPAAYADFRGMDEPRYFHQSCGVNAFGRVAWRELDLNRMPRTLKRGRDPAVAELRSHYHVPLYMNRWKRVETTQDETRDAVLEVLRRRDTSHLVIETYTWPILQSEDKLVTGITKEFRWLLSVLDELKLTRSRKGTGRRDRKHRVK